MGDMSQNTHAEPVAFIEPFGSFCLLRNINYARWRFMYCLATKYTAMLAGSDHFDYTAASLIFQHTGQCCIGQGTCSSRRG